MRNLAAFLITAVMASASYAQEQDNDTFLTPIDAICTTQLVFAETITKYGEVPIMRGISMRNVNGGMVALPTVLFMNMTTGSWTVAELLAENTYCVVAMGRDWEAYQPTMPGTQS